MKPNYAHVSVIIDSSGSMQATADDAVGGFNTLLKEQQAIKGKATMSVMLFDTSFSRIETMTPLEDVNPLTREAYSPSGMTALFDAVGNEINYLGKKLNDMPEEERPDKVIVAIITDGCENSSREYTASKVKEMIEHQQNKYSWEFLFLGANQDSFLEASYIGINLNNVANYTNTSEGTYAAYATISRAVESYRWGQPVNSISNKNN